jgi:hypothetical protein
MSLFPSTQRLVQRIKDTIPYDEKAQLNERLKQPQPVCRCCLAVINGLAGPLREGVELRLIRVGLKPCVDDEAESGRKATDVNVTESTAAYSSPAGGEQGLGNGGSVGVPQGEIRRHRSFGCESVDVQPYEREGTAVYVEGEPKVPTVVVCSGAPVEESSPQVRLQSPASAEGPSTSAGGTGGDVPGEEVSTPNNRDEARLQRLEETRSSRQMKSESPGIRWSAVSAQSFIVNIAGWRPFNRGTHLRFTSPGRSGLLNSTSSTIPSFTDASIHLVMSLAAPSQDHRDACTFIPSSESYPDFGSASLGDRPVTPPPTAGTAGGGGSVGGGPSAVPTAVTNGDSFGLRSALKRGSSKRDKRDLHLKRSESVENFQFETLLPAVWRLSLRAIQKCCVAVHDHSAQTTPTLQLETESQILIFSATDNFSLSRMERAITAAVELSRVRARIHIAAPK